MLESLTFSKKIIYSVTLVIFLSIFWQWISSPMIVTVNGIGEVSVPATYATISFSLTSTDNSIQNAISNVNAKALTIRELLKNRGIAEGDIAEGQVTAVPSNLVTEGSSGYQAVIQMAAKTTNVAEISSLISELYNNGVLVVSQPILSVENQDVLEKQAFDNALADAKKDANAISLANLKFIRKIIAINQATSSNTSTATTKADAATESLDATAAQNGVFKIVKSVSVSYKMW